MIKVYLMQDCGLYDLKRKVIKYVNENLRTIVQVLLDFMEGDELFSVEHLFPRDYWRRKQEECIRNIYELYDILDSNAVKDYLKPKYEHLLYMILEWWEECTDIENDLIPIEIDKELMNELIDNDCEEVIKSLECYDSYYTICFEDIDFLNHSLSNIVEIFLKNPVLVSDVYLDDYLDLMDADIRERYLEATYPKVRESQNTEDKEKGIIEALLAVLKKFQKRVVHFENRGETEISADISDAVEMILNYRYNLHVTREYTMGRANTQIGETDLYIYEMVDGNRKDYAIIENKYIENFSKQYDQLLGYMNQWFEFGITISINRQMKFENALNKIQKDLQNMTGVFAPNDIQVLPEKMMVISQHKVPENGKKMKIYHLIFDLFDEERKQIAKKARK